jgi:predicted  nucleic acid-binding Zn-ribbon protein
MTKTRNQEVEWMLTVKSSSAIKYYHLCKKCKEVVSKSGKVTLKDLCEKCKKKYWKLVKKNGPKYSKRGGPHIKLNAKERVKNGLVDLKEDLLKQRGLHLSCVDVYKAQIAEKEREIKKHIKEIDAVDVELEKLNQLIPGGTKQDGTERAATRG